MSRESCSGTAHKARAGIPVPRRNRELVKGKTAYFARIKRRERKRDMLCCVMAALKRCPTMRGAFRRLKLRSQNAREAGCDLYRLECGGVVCFLRVTRVSNRSGVPINSPKTRGVLGTRVQTLEATESCAFESAVAWRSRNTALRLPCEPHRHTGHVCAADERFVGVTRAQRLYAGHQKRSTVA